MPENRYEFIAHLYLSADGALDGAIQWSSSTIWGRSYTSSGSEFVRGDIKDDGIELHGYKADPMLAPDHYKITLTGGIDSGSFTGISRTCLGDWSGRTHGTYIFLYRE